MSVMPVTVVGGGLAGSEAAWQLAEAGVDVELAEMRPVRPTPIHRGELLAELVCSNSLRGDGPANAVGVLKAEMEEATIQKGKVWRIHYWILNRDKIASLVRLKVPEEGAEEIFSEGKVYENLSESQWERHN